MFRLRRPNNRGGTWLLAALCAAGVAAPFVRADDVAAFLEEQGLDELLIAHLEHELTNASEHDKPGLVRRVASLYAALLEQQRDSAERAGFEARAQLILDQAQASEAMDLRIALAQATYRQIEQIAEAHRLRSSDEAEVARATELATQLGGQLESIRARLQNQLDDSMRKLGRAAGSDSILLAEQSERESNLLDQASYLLAWTRYYEAWMTKNPQPAEAAERLFAQLLATESPKPSPEEVSVDLRANESYARAILGMALCRSITRSPATALHWIALLEHERTAAVVRDAVPAWRLVILLEHGEFAGVAEITASMKGGLESAPLPWLRLIAAWSLEAGGANADALRLARQAMTALAARGALDHLIQLAERYGTEALGSTGFAPLYVQAVLGFQTVREEHPGDKPTGDQSIQQRFAEVGELFERAVAQPDASQYANPAANARLLAAWCKYFRSDFLAAADAFEAAAELAALSDSSEALWMAVVCLDYLVAAGENPALQQRMTALIDEYLARYPAGKHVPQLLLRRSFGEESDPEATIASLLSVPRESGSYVPARQRAAALLYKQFRAAHAGDRAAKAREFIAIAQPLLAPEFDRAIAEGAASDSAKQLVIRCRQILDAATTPEVRDLAAATDAMATLDQLADAGVPLDDVRDEIEARRTQIELIAGRIGPACALADELWTRAGDSPWAQLATRAVFRALLLDRSSGELAEADRETLELIARYGGRVIQEFAGKPEAMARPETMTYQVIVAEATYELWRRTNDEERASASLFLFEHLLERRPSDARFLRVTAELAAALGDDERALECWRALLAGLQQGSEQWYEAKFNQIEVLGRTDPERALGVLAQHVAIENGYGPEPWGERLRTLEAELRVRIEEAGE